jgi:hypothetical protein
MMPWNDGDLNEHQLALRDRISKLANIRGQYKVLGRGQRTTLHSSQDTWVYRMGGCGAEMPDVIVAVNRADSPRDVPLPAGAYVDLMTDNDVDGGGDHQLPAWGILVLTAR